jgi:hypothetical protein
VTLDEAFDKIGFSQISSAFKIQIDHNGIDFELSDWIVVHGDDSNLILVPARDRSPGSVLMREKLN